MAGKARPINRARPARSIRAPQPPDHEFDLSVVQFAPELDLRHKGGLGKAIEPFPRPVPRFGAGQGETLPPPRVPSLADLTAHTARDVSRRSGYAHTLLPCSLPTRGTRLGKPAKLAGAALSRVVKAR